MATPKYKTSKSKAASRKHANMKLQAPALVECQTCGNLIPSHRVCPKCGATYHTKFNPSTAGEKCDKCGDVLSIRKDDAPEVVKSRLVVYHNETEPLKEYYGNKGLVKTVVGQEKLEDTTKLTLEALGI